ncbi:hypothetical protein LCGC14_1755630 [marine sediment metagenome]|uniref:Uncharacterized protein n=1 Tax=marine sediment metagenome TaxID=412755 RepID=A0A0F9JHS6_9ZZZZ
MTLSGEVRDALDLRLTYIRQAVAAIAVLATGDFALVLPTGVDDIWIYYVRVVAAVGGSTDFDLELYDHSDRGEDDLTLLEQNALAPPRVFIRARINNSYVSPVPYQDQTGGNTVWGRIRNNVGAVSAFDVVLGYKAARGLP